VWDRRSRRTRGRSVYISCRFRRLRQHIARGRKIRAGNYRRCCPRRRNRQTSRGRRHHERCTLVYVYPRPNQRGTYTYVLIPAAGVWQYIAKPKVGRMHFCNTKVCDLGSRCCRYRDPGRLRRRRRRQAGEARVSGFDVRIDIVDRVSHLGIVPILTFLEPRSVV